MYKIIRLTSFIVTPLIITVYLVVWLTKSVFVINPSPPTFETHIRDGFIGPSIKINSPSGRTEYAGVNLLVNMRENSKFVLKEKDHILIRVDKATTPPLFRATLIQQDGKELEARYHCYLKKRDGYWEKDENCRASFSYVPDVDIAVSFALGGTEDPSGINREGFGLYIQKYPDKNYYAWRIYPPWQRVAWNLSANIDGQEILLARDITVHYFPAYFVPGTAE